MKEQWKPIAGYEGIYEVSNKGRVKSLDRVVNSARIGFTAKIKGQILKQRAQRDRYYRVGLSAHGKTRHYSVHRLVALAFIENPHNKEQVNHIDRDKLNNKVENLEWVTARENTLHARANGYNPNNNGEKNPQSKLTNKDVYDIVEMLSDGVLQQEIADLYGVCHQAISNIARGVTWTHLTGIKTGWNK